MTTTPNPLLWRSAQPARPRTKADKLAAAARAAAAVRAYDTDPDVIAYRIERMRTRVDRLIWTGLILGLAFTAANVQQFAAQDATSGDIAWWIAWLLDPMVSLVLVGVLLGEQIIARHQIAAGPWVRRTKWTTLALTYGMNTWSAWASLDWSLILLHSVPPAVVFCAAEAVTTLKHQITEAVHKAYGLAAVRAERLSRTADAPVRTALAPAGDVRTDGGDDLRTDEQSRTEREAADRDAVVAELVTEIMDAAERGTKWTPDYPALMLRTGFKKSWCEKRVAEAKSRALGMPRTSRTTEETTEAEARTEPGGTGLDRTGHQDSSRTDDRTDSANTTRRTDAPDRTADDAVVPVRLAGRTDGTTEQARTEVAA